MQIVVAGGTGQIGSILCKFLKAQGHDVTLLSRSAGTGRVVWDAKTVGDWATSLECADAVINLCGVSIVNKWTPSYWSEIENSRLLSTRAIAQAISTCKAPPSTWINASAVGYYGDTGDREVVEATRAGNNKLGQLCHQWESECLKSPTPETRKICLRIGVVLEQDLRIVKILSYVAKMGLCAPLGSGGQYMSWIHWEDLMRMFEWCLKEPVSGAINATAPHPVTNREMTGLLRQTYCRPPLPTVPTGIVKLVASVAGLEPELLLTGQRVLPEIALARGFRFKYDVIEPALLDVLGSTPKAWQPA